MDKSKIWVIVRSQGEYSDRSEDCVCWFPSKTAAEAFVERATQTSREAARQCDSFKDEKNYDYTEADLEQFKVGLVDKSFSPGSYGATDASYYAQEIDRGELS